MKKVWCQLALLLWLAAPASAFDLRIEGNRLSLRAAGEPLQAILAAIAGQGIAVRVDSQFNPRVSALFERREIGEAVGSLVAPYDHALVWTADAQEGAPLRLAEIRIFSPGQKERLADPASRVFSLARNPADGSLYVRDELLLRVRTAGELEKLLKLTGGAVVEAYAALSLYRIRLPRDADVPAWVGKLRSLSDGAEAEPNFAYPVSAPYRVGAPSAMARIPQEALSSGRVPVAVLDSGLSAAATPGGAVVASLDALAPERPITDPVGHGTQMALIASGAVKPLGVPDDAAEDRGPVIAVRAMDDHGVTTDAAILKSIDFAVANGARVLSLSWGSEKDSPFLGEMMAYAQAQGLILVAAAGNEPTGRPVYPAAYPAVIGVGAAYPDGKTWERSNEGDFVSLHAPGFASLPVGYRGEPGIYGGTSIAAAYVANRIAAYLSDHPEAGLAQIRAALKQSPIPLGQ